ncbi:MAG: LysR family transcriptional regulator [Pseudomonadota bacterium]
MNENERPLMDTDLLRTFVVIAHAGNLTVAAGHLSRTQSAVSVQLRKLEDGLGATLFNRTPKGMTLTAQGEALLPRARALLAEIRKTGALFADPLTGSIRVGLPDDFDATVLERILAGFARQHPGVNVIASSGCTSRYPAAIRDGALDIAVYSAPDNHEGDPLGDERTIWAAGSEFRIAPDEPVPLATLDRACWWRDLPAETLDRVGRSHVIAFRSSSFTSLQAAVRAGIAVGILPARSLCPKTRELRLKDGFPELPLSRRSIVVSAAAPADLTGAMATAIRNAWRDDADGLAS